MSEIKSYDKKSLVRSGIIGSILKFSKPRETLIYPFLDYLYLYFQPSKKDDPLVFMFWEGDRCIFSSFNDLYYTRKYRLIKENFTPPSHRLPLSNSGFYLSIHKVNSQKLRQFEKKKNAKSNRDYLVELQNKLLPVDSKKTKRLKILFEDSLFKLFFIERGTLNSLLSAIQSEIKDLYMSKLVDDYEKQIDEDLNIKFVNKCTDGLRVILDECWQDIRDFLSINSQNKPQLGNIFCVIRMAYYKDLRYTVFPYTAKILLSKNQANILQDWMEYKCNKCRKNCKVKNGANIVDVLEAPLSKNARAIADLVFCSGIVEFGREPSEEIWDTYKKNSEMDENRQWVENCIYPSGYIYYVPIHVGGHPWLALFTFSSGKDRWLYNYTFYRDIVSIVATKLRLKALDEYISQIGAIFRDEIKKGLSSKLDFIQRINKKLKSLARIYPFPLLYLEDKSSTQESKRIDIFSHRDIPIVCKRNPFFGDPQVKYNALDNKIFLETVFVYLNREIKQILELHSLNLSMHTAVFSHAIPTHIAKIKANIRFKNDKEALKGLDYLSNFCNLAMAAIDQRRKIQLTRDIKSAREFVNMINEFIVDITREITPRYSTELDFSFSSNLNKIDVIEYIKEYFQEAIYEVMLNAIKYSKKNTTVEIKLSQEDKNNKVFLIVSNYSKMDFQNTEQTIKALMDGSSKSLGTEFLKCAAKACDYTFPEWKYEKDGSKTRIVTKIQIAEWR